MPAHRYMEGNSSIVMLALKRLASVVLEVNFKKHGMHTPPPSMNKVVHSGFETQRKKFKTLVSVAPQKDLCPPKFKKIFAHSKYCKHAKNSNFSAFYLLQLHVCS